MLRRFHKYSHSEFQRLRTHTLKLMFCRIRTTSFRCPKPRPQLLPEPMCTVAYLPLVELLNREVTKSSLYASLLNDQISKTADSAKVLDALKGLASGRSRPRVLDHEQLWKAFFNLRQAEMSGNLDGPELDKFTELFSDPKAVRERLLVWSRDRHQQPNAMVGPLKLEPAWLDFLEIDLTLDDDEPLPTISVPAWQAQDGE
jgi:hypothetical protein